MGDENSSGGSLDDDQLFDLLGDDDSTADDDDELVDANAVDNSDSNFTFDLEMDGIVGTYES